ncbi:MAG TPA: hypothetical protein VM888_01620 [Chitinophagaceae bacterium]|nr:hypothetical protein [Chitinophagaceae bacterium]
MKKLISVLFLFCTLGLIGCTQSRSQKSSGTKAKPTVLVGGSCEGCEAIYESPVPFEKLSWIDTLPDFTDEGPKLEISGTVYKADGKTPAKDVVLYIYHTNQKGRYPTKGDEKGWGKRHGYIRGWMKTNKEGKYKFYTLRPGHYPDFPDAAHIHPVVKEPGKNEYYIDAYLFNDDPLLNSKVRNKLENRGGDGILKLKEKNGIWYAERNIYLGKNIPDYTAAIKNSIESGLTIGSDCPAFDPLHISGADVGKKACPMCKYGFGQGVMIWFKNENLESMNDFAKGLEREMQKRGESKFRVFLVYMNSNREIIPNRNTMSVLKIKEWCSRQSLNKVAVLWVPSTVDEHTAGAYKINAAAKNTVFLYKQRVVAAKWVNMDYNNKSLAAILKQL